MNKIECKCEVCGKKFMVKIADRKRGWARCCSKSCAATKNNRKTGNFITYQIKRHLAIMKEEGLCYPSLDMFQEGKYLGDCD